MQSGEILGTKCERSVSKGRLCAVRWAASDTPLVASAGESKVTLLPPWKAKYVRGSSGCLVPVYLLHPCGKSDGMSSNTRPTNWKCWQKCRFQNISETISQEDDLQ